LRNSDPGRSIQSFTGMLIRNSIMVKRFIIEESEKPQCFINENPESKLISLTEVEYPRFEIYFGGKNKGRDNEIIEVSEFIGIKSYKAKGKG